MKIRALIVDDEPWARKRIVGLLKAERDLEIIGECADGEEAISKIVALSPDLVFLDVQMPAVDGFEVLEAVGPERMPVVIFVTAYDQYAVRAFEARALDYLLKPFHAERFQAALARARDDLRLKRGVRERELRALLDALHPPPRYLQRLLVKSSGRVVFLKAADVDWFESSGNYVTLHVGRESHLLRHTMEALERKLDPERFARIHRSTMVNLDRVKELQPWFRGEQMLVLKDGTQLTVGRAFRERLRRFLENATP